MVIICPKCGRIAEYLPYCDGTSCTTCDWYFIGEYHKSDKEE
jgi:CDGSH-type Zn-finger protein